MIASDSTGPPASTACRSLAGFVDGAAPQREERGEEFSLRAFFDALNATDSIPIALSRWEMTGLGDEIEYLLDE